ADGFDIVPVWIEYESGIVVGVVMRPQPRRAIVPTAGGDCRGVERIDFGARGRCKGDMDWARGCARCEPELGLAAAEPGGGAAAFRKLHLHLDAERLQRSRIKGSGAGEVAHIEAD